MGSSTPTYDRWIRSRGRLVHGALSVRHPIPGVYNVPGADGGDRGFLGSLTGRDGTRERSRRYIGGSSLSG